MNEYSLRRKMQARKTWAELCGYLLLAVVVLLARVGCSTSPATREAAEQTLAHDGYTDAAVEGFRWWGCDGAWRSTRFTATAPSGDAVFGAVCCGVALRGCSIRTDLPGDHR